MYRIVAESGDSLQIINGELFLNRQPSRLPSSGKSLYQIKTEKPIEVLAQADPMTTQIKRSGYFIIYECYISHEQATNYSQMPGIIDVKRKLQEISLPDVQFAITSPDQKWSLDNYGPLYIPGPGELILVNERNYKIYKNIPGIEMGRNIIKEKLYFLMGDNWYGAEDSRFIGLISHSNMYGIVK